MIIIKGEINITSELTYYDRFFLFNFNLTPRFKRDSELLKKYYKFKNGYNGYYGTEGQFFIKYKVDAYGENIENLTNDNYDVIVDKSPPNEQPSKWCPQKPNLQGNKLLFEGSEYSRAYGWLKWLIKNIFKNKYLLNGDINISDDNKEIELKIKNNKLNYYFKNINNQKDKIENKLKTNDEIVNNLINLTKNNKIKWIKDKNIIIEKYIISIPVKDINVKINLFIRNFNTNQNYINIYIQKNNRDNFFKTINGYKINELIKNVVQKQKQKQKYK